MIVMNVYTFLEKRDINMERHWEVDLLLLAWDDFDRVLSGISEADAIRQIGGGSSFAWTLAHVTNGIDSWINVRFLEQEPDPLLSSRRFALGSDGSADDWLAIQLAVDNARASAKPFLLACTAEDLDRTVSYDGGHPAFQKYGLNLRMAILQNAIHHNYHLGEIATKQELVGLHPGVFPGAIAEQRQRRQL